MAENTFKSPGFFEQEIELTAEKQQPTGVPAGIIGAAQMGPAFVPLTLGTFRDFENRFGSLTPEKFAPYAVREWLKNRQSVTFMRVLGAGANSTSTDFGNTKTHGFVKNTGFKISPASATAKKGAVQFLTAEHTILANSDVGFPIYTDNDEFAGVRETTPSAADSDDVKLIRGMILNTSGSYFELDDTATTASWGVECDAQDDNGSNSFAMKLIDEDATEYSWGNDDSGTGSPNRVFTVSLDPDNTKYIGKVLNTDPKKFQEEGHLLWLDFAVEHELAKVAASNKVCLQSGDLSAASYSGDYATKQGVTTYNQAFGLFNARYQAPKTTSFISQPFGSVEYDLFHFECLSDGHVANNNFKVSISNIKRSSDPNYKYGTFDVLVRNFADSDFNPQVLERFVGCSLDPNSDNFVAKKIGDKKVVFNFDADLEEERRLVISGRYPNTSLNVRIVMNEGVYKDQVPAEALPFGFRGIPVLNPTGKLDVTTSAIANESKLPPLPFTYKATKGKIKASGYSLSGEAGTNERADARIYWGVKTTRIEDDAISADAVLESNLSGRLSSLTKAYTKFMGIGGGTADNGLFKRSSDADVFNHNKFTLARVALSSTPGTAIGSPSSEIKQACYIRNKTPDVTDYHVKDTYDTTAERQTFASLVHGETVNDFNKFSKYMKFTNVFYGGWDGLNILDQDIEDLNDKAASSEVTDGGKAGMIAGGLGLYGTNSTPGTETAMMGEGKDNNVIASYRQAIKVMTDPMTVRTNILAIPGIRDPYVADFAAGKVRDYSMAMYVMDIPNYNGGNSRIFDTGSRPDVEYTSNTLESRAIDNNYVASYFPDVYVTDPVNNRRVLVPASIAALGALSYNDNVSYPWFAPAGFNRGALDFVENVRTRLAVSDRDDLYERRINPIANFPNGGFVIFGQKTMQMNQSALDRVNVRRLLLEVKRQVAEVANVVLFEQNTPQTRARFVNLVQPRLALIQAQAGIEKFRVICDDTNNTPADAEENRLNGKIVLIPTRTIEFIAIDFIITNAGVSFE
jgi:hypothetical protein